MAKYKIKVTYPNGETEQLRDGLESYEEAKEEMIKIILSAVQRNDPPILSISRYVSK